MGLLINIVCRNLNDDRVIPRFARYLRDHLGWTLTAAPDPHADIVYLSGYFEAQLCKLWPSVPVAAMFTHREEEPPGNEKARLFDSVAKRVDLRVAMCRLYREPLSKFGPTIQPPLPLERDKFVIAGGKRQDAGRRKLVVGFSGYTYRNHRKGEDLVAAVVGSKIGRSVEWRASGRGWPVPMKRYSWAEMPSFFQGLDVFVCPSRVEGGPMPVLEALACGVRVVIPRGVGILDELRDAPGIHRYERGNPKALVAALGAAVSEKFDREALRAVTEPYSVAAWVKAHAKAIPALAQGPERVDAGIEGVVEVPVKRTTPTIKAVKPRVYNTGSTRGIYMVAFGRPSRKSGKRLLLSIKKHMPDIPVCVCGASKLGGEDVFIRQPDSDVGGRRAKLKAYELAPAEWKAVLYLDADTLVTAPIYRYFEWIEAGWEFVICKDPHLMDTMHAFERRNNRLELRQIEQEISTLHALQINGGVWAFQHDNARVAGFFRRWQQEWEQYAQRDQGALLRALYADPLKVLWLGNEWNTFEKYCKGLTTAGLMHYPGDARRWKGMIPGRIDSPEAWRMVRQWEREHAAPGTQRKKKGK
jgi:hypothetical protein